MWKLSKVRADLVGWTAPCVNNNSGKSSSQHAHREWLLIEIMGVLWQFTQPPHWNALREVLLERMGKLSNLHQYSLKCINNFRCPHTMCPQLVWTLTMDSEVSTQQFWYKCRVVTTAIIECPQSVWTLSVDSISHSHRILGFQVDFKFF